MYEKVLLNQIVLITGAGGGIGFETAKCFAAMGAQVIILEIDSQKGKRAEKQINSPVRQSSGILSDRSGG